MTDERNEVLVLVPGVPGGPGLIGRVEEIIEIIDDLPIPFDVEPMSGYVNLRVKVCHDDGCGSKVSREEGDCTCETVNVEITGLSPFEAAVMEETKDYDHMVVSEKERGPEAADDFN